MRGGRGQLARWREGGRKGRGPFRSIPSSSVVNLEVVGTIERKSKRKGVDRPTDRPTYDLLSLSAREEVCAEAKADGPHLTSQFIYHSSQTFDRGKLRSVNTW